MSPKGKGERTEPVHYDPTLCKCPTNAFVELWEIVAYFQVALYGRMQSQPTGMLHFLYLCLCLNYFGSVSANTAVREKNPSAVVYESDNWQYRPKGQPSQTLN